ncbi:hypothetical protein DICPUDRAFT_75859 [Dictyostelium purpureum]|uniref:CUE domain-containing protein n=1 Tax=Dictyostelium purpureum TaxID=5786 RepID=F0ZBV8_DICPU|nr:uncharacterized protein DICPUDRAFT_75859 [Dictyostelium purpureum]EGC38527.1 hypothetical protein DICPUDRAFT_75859 [Dictyostelium purpureum]|eukprot:XP_003284898.1 hypothetical protein DICPUDRAFT_75859 [Dictyostelium purpureum]
MNSSSPPIQTTTTTSTENKDIKEETFETNDDDLDNKNNNNNNNNNNNTNNNSNINNDKPINNDSSLPSIRDYSLDKNKKETDQENHLGRFEPYGGNNKKVLNFQERLETVELVVSMFPLLEKDQNVYKILNKYDWNVEASINELQRRHDFAEKSLVMTGAASFPQDETTFTTPKELQQQEMKTFTKRRYKGIYSHPTNTQDDFDRMDDFLEEEEEEEEDFSFEKNITEDLMEVKDEKDKESDDNSIDNKNSPNSKQSALDFSRFPNFKQDIQTLRDIFGTAFHEYELKGFYMVCSGNLELVIDQLVNEQKQKDSTPVKQQPQQQQPQPQPRQPLTAKLSEEEKRQLQLQLIEEQEKLEKKFSDKKQQEINSHPSKKNFSQQEIVNELKDLFSKHVEEGVIEWVAYSCDYDLGKSTTQLVDLKHSNLLKKNAAAAAGAANANTTTSPTGLQLDPNLQAQIENNINILSKGLISLPSFDTITDQIKNLNANDNENANQSSNNNFKSIFNRSNISPPTNTTTTTTTSNNTIDQNSSSSTPVFQQNFVYEKK